MLFSSWYGAVAQYILPSAAAVYLLVVKGVKHHRKEPTIAKQIDQEIVLIIQMRLKQTYHQFLKIQEGKDKARLFINVIKESYTSLDIDMQMIY